MTPFESGGSGGTSLTLSKRYSAALSSDGQAASATDSLRESREYRSGRLEADALDPAHAEEREAEDPECREFAYDVGSTTLVTTQRCLPILRSRTNPSFS